MSLEDNNYEGYDNLKNLSIFLIYKNGPIIINTIYQEENNISYIF